MVDADVLIVGGRARTDRMGALYDAFKSWRDGGPTCSGRFAETGAWKPKLSPRPTRYDQDAAGRGSCR
jgi:hypothetical protein